MRAQRQQFANNQSDCESNGDGFHDFTSHLAVTAIVQASLAGIGMPRQELYIFEWNEASVFITFQLTCALRLLPITIARWGRRTAVKAIGNQENCGRGG